MNKYRDILKNSCGHGKTLLDCDDCITSKNTIIKKYDKFDGEYTQDEQLELDVEALNNASFRQRKLKYIKNDEVNLLKNSIKNKILNMKKIYFTENNKGKQFVTTFRVEESKEYPKAVECIVNDEYFDEIFTMPLAEIKEKITEILNLNYPIGNNI